MPASGRSASLAVFGTIGCGGALRRPNSPLPVGSMLMSPQPACRHLEHRTSASGSTIRAHGNSIVRAETHGVETSRREYGEIRSARRTRSAIVALEDERRVGAAEAEGVGQRDIDLRACAPCAAPGRSPSRRSGLSRLMRRRRDIVADRQRRRRSPRPRRRRRADGRSPTWSRTSRPSRRRRRPGARPRRARSCRPWSRCRGR